MKNILSKIKIDYSYYVLAISYILTGYFKHLLILTSIIIIHELGHILVALFFKYDLYEIKLYAFGGRVKYNEKINKSITKELMVVISGVVMQSIYFFIISPVITINTYFIFKKYYLSILIFNLLPIINLDGSKIVELILGYFISYKKSLYISWYISIIVTIGGSVYLVITNNINYSYIMIVSIIISSTVKYYTRIKYLFHKFLLERYLNIFNYKKTIIIKSISRMRKSKRHILNNSGKYITERNFLRQLFDFEK